MIVYITRPIPEIAAKLLKAKGFEVKINPVNIVLTKDDLIREITGVDAVLALLTDKIDNDVFHGAGTGLKIVANYAVGYDNIDLAAARAHKVMVTNTPGVLTEAVAEHSWALILAVARKIVESDKFVREGKYIKWEPLGFLGPQLEGKTIGIFGLGRIGSKVAEIAKHGFKMNVAYNDVKPNAEFESQLSAKFLSVDELLTLADVVSIHVPLLPETTHLINAERLIKMKPSAILINTSRGPIVDENALVNALKNNKIAGAGLDVFENEPKLAAGLAELSNVVLTPHSASATSEARQAMAKIAAENIIAALSGQTPPNLVK